MTYSLTRRYKIVIHLFVKSIITKFKDFSKIWGISPKECVAVGDEGNDVAMLKTAGVGVCMKNADDWVKKEADYVTINDNNSSGVAEVIYKFLLSGEKK